MHNNLMTFVQFAIFSWCIYARNIKKRAAEVGVATGTTKLHCVSPSCSFTGTVSLQSSNRALAWVNAMQRTTFCSRHFLFRLLNALTALLAIGASISAASFRTEDSAVQWAGLESGVSDFVPPRVHYDVTATKLWRW